MNLFELEHHRAFRAQVREFAENEIRPLAPELDANETFSVELTRKMGQAGFMGIDIPQEYGGQGRDTLSYIIAVEEIARVDGSQAATLAAHNSLGVAPIFLFGSESQRKAYLPALCNGEGLWAFGLTEEMAGSDARGVQTTATLDEGCWMVNGQKRYITNGSNALLKGITALAMTGENNGKAEYSTILVDRHLEGFATERMLGKMMWRASDTARIHFKGVKVPQGALLGERGKGLSHMLQTLDGGRLSIAAMGLGLAIGAFEAATAYAQRRSQFGQAIAQNQAIQFKLAEMATKIELARNTLYHTCMLKDKKLPFGKQAAISKLYCSEIAKEIADQAIQIYGGAGLFQNSPVERFYRDQRLLQIGEGTSEILHLVIARQLMNEQN